MANPVRFSIGLKLSLIVSVLLAIALSLITALVAFLVGADVRLTAESNNWTMNHWSATAAENILSANRDKSLFLIRSMNAVSAGGGGAEIETLTGRFFRLNPDISCVAFIGAGDNPGGMVVNERFGAGSGFRAALSAWLENNSAALTEAGGGKTLLFNTGGDLEFPSLVMLFNLPAEEGFSFSGAGAVFFSPLALEESLSGADSGGADNATFIANTGAEIITQSAAAVDGDSAAVVRQAVESNSSAQQTVFTADGGERYYAAFQRLSGIEAVVITQVGESLITARVNRAIISIIIISALVLLVSIFAIALYSRTITRPLKALTEGARAIEEGNYQPSLQVKTRDEIGSLTGSFIEMGQGLANFERFTNKQIVALARREQLSRTGERKTVTVCFTMIKNFKALTRGMDPRRIVDFVNSVLAALVPCVTRTGGLVDKFLTQGGLVVMSLWGAAKSSGSPESDAFNCIRSALMMRNVLRRMNLNRIAGGEPGVLVAMGCGINSGEVVAGQIGSEERMEYTVIGDTVNLAARIEEPNETFDTDILITENTHRLVGKYIKAEEMPRLEVKGQSKPLRVFAAVNILNYYGPSTMEDVRKTWRI